jgi:2,3-bisphosphoglycerate-dependent phosphoglycerate mutase
VHIWRRSFDTPPPGGESLKDTADRVLPYFNSDHHAAHTSKARIFWSRRMAIVCARWSCNWMALQPNEIIEVNIGTGEPYFMR